MHLLINHRRSRQKFALILSISVGLLFASPSSFTFMLHNAQRSLLGTGERKAAVGVPMKGSSARTDP